MGRMTDGLEDCSFLSWQDLLEEAMDEIYLQTVATKNQLRLAVVVPGFGLGNGRQSRGSRCPKFFGRRKEHPWSRFIARLDIELICSPSECPRANRTK